MGTTAADEQKAAGQDGPGVATDDGPELCGHPTASGEPCSLVAEYCPHHGPDAVGNPGSGRPIDYRPEYCELVVEMGAEGKTFAQMAAHLDVTRDTLYRWRDNYPEFSDALTLAREKSLAEWERLGHSGLNAGKDFNDRVYKFITTNRFPDDYKDRREVAIHGHLDVTRLPDALLARIQEGEDPTVVLASAAAEAQAQLQAPREGEVPEADYEVVEEG